MTTKQRKTTSYRWIVVYVVVWCLQFMSGVVAVPQEMKDRTFSHWGFPTCPAAMEFFTMGFTKVQEATMVTGTITCPEDWKQEYPGHLVTWRDDLASTEVECINITHINTLRSSQYVQGQAFIFYTNSACGELQWPPYSQDGGVMCAVCSK